MRALREHGAAISLARPRWSCTVVASNGPLECDFPLQQTRESMDGGLGTQGYLLKRVCAQRWSPGDSGLSLCLSRRRAAAHSYFFFPSLSISATLLIGLTTTFSQGRVTSPLSPPPILPVVSRPSPWANLSQCTDSRMTALAMNAILASHFFLFHPNASSNSDTYSPLGTHTPSPYPALRTLLSQATSLRTRSLASS